MTTELPDWLAHRAHVRPGHPALITAAESMSYQALDQRASAVAGALAARGVVSGDRVAVMGESTTTFVEAVHALPRCGAVLVPLNPRLTTEELAWQIGRVRPRLVIVSTGSEEAARAAAGTTPVVTGEELRSDMEAVPSRRRDPNDLHSVLFTSGTTGRPRGVMLTYGNFWASAVGSAFNLGVSPDDRWLAAMPLFHVGGLSILLRSVIYGTTVVLHNGFDEYAVNRAIREEGVTLFSAVATMLQRMLDADDAPYPPSLRGALIGGGPVPGPLLERAIDRGIPVLQTYGLTEATSQVCTLEPSDAVNHLGSAGKPLLGTEVRVDAPASQPGEILVSGPTITPGYFEEPEVTAERIRDGWLHTGDIGRMDADGFLYVLDRRNDLIVSGGENISPVEVEKVLMEHPSIDEAAVIGLPDPHWGHRVVAAIVAAPTLDDAAIEAWLRPRLASYKRPREFRRVEALPRTASGKVQRHVLRERWAAPE